MLCLPTFLNANADVITPRMVGIAPRASTMLSIVDSIVVPESMMNLTIPLSISVDERRSTTAVS